MSKWVCTFCVKSKGVKGSELDGWPDYDDSEGQARHLESVHHLPVKRDYETPHECQERFHKEYPEAGGPSCRCPKCVQDREIKVILSADT